MGKSPVVIRKIENIMLAQNFEYFFKHLPHQYVEYMVVDSYTSAIHCKPRHTRNLDM